MTATAQSGNTRASVIVGIIQAVLFCLMQLYEIIGLDEGDEPAGGKDTGNRVNGGHSQNQSTGTTNKTATATPGAAGPRVPQPAPKVPGGHSQSQSTGTTNKTAGMPQSRSDGPAVKMTNSPPMAQYKGMPPMGMGGMPMGGMPMGGMPMGMGGMPMYR